MPDDRVKREERCREILSIQAAGLAKRLSHTGMQKLVLGISGGLDSTLALLVSVRTMELLKLPTNNIICVTMPGFGTTDRTYDNAVELIQCIGATFREIDIRPACLQHMADIGHDPILHDVTYENTQARERTQILMDLANKEGGILVGTGDLSELALGWCTYNADHMSMYGVNCGVPKTLVRHLVENFAAQADARTRVCCARCSTRLSAQSSCHRMRLAKSHRKQRRRSAPMSCTISFSIIFSASAQIPRSFYFLPSALLAINIPNSNSRHGCGCF